MRENLERVALKISGLSLQREVVFAERCGNKRFVIRSIPAFVYGVAYGDEIEIIDDDAGEFRVLKRSGQVTVRVFVSGKLERHEIDNVIEQISGEGGLHEIGKSAKDPSHQSLLLLSIPMSVGFSKIEEMMRIMEHIPVKWEYGNVYSDDGTPLGWWEVPSKLV